MEIKVIGAWLVVIGIALLIGYYFYKIFQIRNIPLFIKIGIGIIIIGIIIFIPAMIKEAKKDKVVLK